MIVMCFTGIIGMGLSILLLESKIILGLFLISLVTDFKFFLMDQTLRINYAVCSS